MPNPKRRHSNTRSRLRRAHDFLTPAELTVCPQCKTQIFSHRVCPHCGHYRGKQVFTLKTEDKGKTK